jgi:hypothetical protein
MDFISRRRVLILVSSVALAVAALALPRASSAAPPEAVNFSVITVGSCGFPVRIDITGKAKTVELLGGRSLVISPGARATLTNLADPSNQVSYPISGAYHETNQADDDLVEVVTTGRVLLFDRSFGMFLAIGRFTFGFDEEEGTFDARPTGTGKWVDVCANLE